MSIFNQYFDDAGPEQSSVLVFLFSLQNTCCEMVLLSTHNIFQPRKRKLIHIHAILFSGLRPSSILLGKKKL